MPGQNLGRPVTQLEACEPRLLGFTLTCPCELIYFSVTGVLFKLPLDWNELTNSSRFSEKKKTNTLTCVLITWSSKKSSNSVTFSFKYVCCNLRRWCSPLGGKHWLTLGEPTAPLVSLLALASLFLSWCLYWHICCHNPKGGQHWTQEIQWTSMPVTFCILFNQYCYHRPPKIFRHSLPGFMVILPRVRWEWLDFRDTEKHQINREIVSPRKIFFAFTATGIFQLCRLLLGRERIGVTRSLHGSSGSKLGLSCKETYISQIIFPCCTHLRRLQLFLRGKLS